MGLLEEQPGAVLDSSGSPGYNAGEEGLFQDDAGAGGANTLSNAESEEYAFNAIKGPNKADTVVIGKYEEGATTSYDAVAKNMDAQYFNKRKKGC